MGRQFWLALDASVVLRQGQNQREVPLSAFYGDYMRNVMAPGEWVERIRVPSAGCHIGHCGPQTRSFTCLQGFKAPRQRHFSACCAAFALQLGGTTIVAARLAWRHGCHGPNEHRWQRAAL